MTAPCADRAPGTAADRVGGTGICTDPPSDGADARLLTAVLHGAFFLLLGGALARFPLNHSGEARTPWITALSDLSSSVTVCHGVRVACSVTRDPGTRIAFDT
ncbi:hypothetical protein [Streptomyces sp. NPDC059215]|uniref:hypothetical protein n=1 Tax=Streptomyces sp. NPDC059215 TaxID=3346772 RepID=UPI003698D764